MQPAPPCMQQTTAANMVNRWEVEQRVNDAHPTPDANTAIHRHSPIEPNCQPHLKNTSRSN
eukprot:1162015-Pelagomonas_calceolata.AAC.4